MATRLALIDSKGNETTLYTNVAHLLKGTPRMILDLLEVGIEVAQQRETERRASAIAETERMASAIAAAGVRARNGGGR